MARKPHPDQFPLDWSRDAQLERMIEARVAIRAERDATRWRIRLIGFEAVMRVALVALAGFSLGQPVARTLHVAIGVGVACVVSGLLFVGLSAITAVLVARFYRWRGR